MSPWPRRLGADPAAQEQAARWRVQEESVRAWLVNRMRGRRDTFIGLIDTDTGVLYLAPCFGIRPAEAKRKLIRANVTVAGGELEQLRRRCGRLHEIPDDLELVIGSTAVEDEGSGRATWAEVRAVYERHALLVPFNEQKGNGFDGNSHPTFRWWIDANTAPPPADGWWSRALGFGIQVDPLGYYVRFASTLNETPGMSGASTTTFVPRVSDPRDAVFEPRDKGATRETRDLPSEWARHLVHVLARDLHVGYFNAEPPARPDDERDRTVGGRFFGRMQARGDGEKTTKFKRITLAPVANPFGEAPGLAPSPAVAAARPDLRLS